MAIRLMWVRDWPYGKEDGQVIENAELVASYRTDAPDIARRLQSALARIATLEAEQREADDGPLTFSDMVTLDVFLEALAEEDIGGHDGDDSGCDLCAGVAVLKKITKAARARREARESEAAQRLFDSEEDTGDDHGG